jgi:hypothetical protein
MISEESARLFLRNFGRPIGTVAVRIIIEREMGGCTHTFYSRQRV